MQIESNFISRYRQKVTVLLDAIAALEAEGSEWAARDYGNTLVEEDHFIGENEEVTLAELTAAKGSIDALRTTYLNAGHATNLYKVRM